MLWADVKCCAKVLGQPSFLDHLLGKLKIAAAIYHSETCATFDV